MTKRKGCNKKMENNETQNTLSIRDLWSVFINNIFIIACVALLSFALVFSYSFITYTPKYTSTATIYILRQGGDDSDSNGTVNSDFSLALSTVNDCTVLLTSRNVLDQVKDKLGLSVSYKQLKSMISIHNPNSTRILMISITDYNPADAKKIVDELCEIGAQSITETMGINQINIIDYGTYEEAPSNSKINKYSVLFGLMAAAVVYGIYLLIFMLNDRIKTVDDVEKYLNLSVLGYIPNKYEKNGHLNGGAYKKYGKYKKYGDNGNQY